MLKNRSPGNAHNFTRRRLVEVYRSQRLLIFFSKNLLVLEHELEVFDRSGQSLAAIVE
jgi:hypothetical protein